MAGDRGLAFVLVALMAVTLLSRIDANRTGGGGGTVVAAGGEQVFSIALGKMGRSIAGDYQAFHDRLRSLVAMNAFRAPSAIDFRDFSAPDYMAVDEKSTPVTSRIPVLKERSGRAAPLDVALQDNTRQDLPTQIADDTVPQ